MSRLEDLKLRLLCRKVVRVLQYLDEEETMPWDYVERHVGGGFEAFVTVMERRDDGVDWYVPLSLGVFDDVNAATHAVREYNKQTRALDSIRFQETQRLSQRLWAELEKHK
jgi:hypothetical protein